MIGATKFFAQNSFGYPYRFFFKIFVDIAIQLLCPMYFLNSASSRFVFPQNAEPQSTLWIVATIKLKIAVRNSGHLRHSLQSWSQKN